MNLKVIKLRETYYSLSHLWSTPCCLYKDFYDCTVHVSEFSIGFVTKFELPSQITYKLNATPLIICHLDSFIPVRFDEVDCLSRLRRTLDHHPQIQISQRNLSPQTK